MKKRTVVREAGALVSAVPVDPRGGVAVAAAGVLVVVHTALEIAKVLVEAAR